MEHEHVPDTEHLFSGYLTLGEQKKDGTQISFKDKSRRFFALRCLRQRFVTLSGYKNIKEFRHPSGSHHKTVEQIVVSKNAKIHSMQLPSKKHKHSNVLCIIQDKETVYLEADTREDLSAWYAAFDKIFIRLGWKQPPSSPPSSPPPLPTRPAEPLPPEPVSSNSFPQHSLTSNGHNQNLREVGSGPTMAEAFDSRQSPQEDEYLDPSMRYSSPPSTNRNFVAGAAASAVDVGRPKSTDHEWHIGTESHRTTDQTFVETDPGQQTQDLHAWLGDSELHQERLINVQDLAYYVNVGRGVDSGQLRQMTHPMPPPTLPPKQNLHRRGHTFPGAHLSLPQSDSSPYQSPRSSGDFEDGNQPVRASSERTPTINITDPPASPLTHQRFQHLFEDSDITRKVSLPQPLNPKSRRPGVVVPPPPLSFSPPDSPVQLRKAGSYSNLALNLSSRPLPSPVNGGSFDVNTLRWEMSHTDGFPLVLDKTELQDSLGLVRIADYVWVAGWKAGKPDIAKKLHVGDQLRQINEQIVVDPAVTNTLFATSAVNEILLVIRRLPYAKVRLLQRSSVEDSWGLEVDGNRILNVSKSGPAADAKVTTRAQGAFSERLCDWIITEINGEPVSLLSKRDQVKNRMANAGLQMALVIQPDDFIKKLNAELQKVKFAHEYFVGSESQDLP